MKKILDFFFAHPSRCPFYNCTAKPRTSMSTQEEFSKKTSVPGRNDSLKGNHTHKNGTEKAKTTTTRLLAQGIKRGYKNRDRKEEKKKGKKSRKSMGHSFFLDLGLT